MHFTKSISLDMETARKINQWMLKNDISNLSFAIDHLLKVALDSRNNGVGVTQKRLLTATEDLFEEVLIEQKLKKPRVMKNER